MAEWVAFLAISHSVLVGPPITAKTRTVLVDPRCPVIVHIPVRTYTMERRIRIIVNNNNKNTGC